MRTPCERSISENHRRASVVNRKPLSIYSEADSQDDLGAQGDRHGHDGCLVWGSPLGLRSCLSSCGGSYDELNRQRLVRSCVAVETWWDAPPNERQRLCRGESPPRSNAGGPIPPLHTIQRMADADPTGHPRPSQAGMSPWATWALCIREEKSVRFRDRGTLPIVPLPRRPLRKDHEPWVASWDGSWHDAHREFGRQLDSREECWRRGRLVSL